MLVLQSLRLVDGEDAHTTGDVALDGFRADGLVPLVEESSDVGGIVVDEVHELVIEGTDVGTLTCQPLQAEDGVETFGEIVERHGAEVREMGDEGFWQEGIERGGRIIVTL